jgi:hypothetical protein
MKKVTKAIVKKKAKKVATVKKIKTVQIKLMAFEIIEYDINSQKYLPSRIVLSDSEFELNTINVKRREDLDKNFKAVAV